MDDEAIGADQARRLRAALAGAELELSRVWVRYFRLGGEVSEMEIDAYLHHALALPALQRDLLAHAVFELAERHRIPHLPFTIDYQTLPSSFRRLEEWDGPLGQPPPGREDHNEDPNDQER